MRRIRIRSALAALLIASFTPALRASAPGLKLPGAFDVSAIDGFLSAQVKENNRVG